VTPVTRAVSPARQLPVAETVLAAVGEAVLLATYASQDAVYHWLTHLLAGGTAALTALAAVAAVRRRPVRSAPLWVLLGHVIAVIPDVLFAAGLATNHGWTSSSPTSPATTSPVGYGRSTPPSSSPSPRTYSASPTTTPPLTRRFPFVSEICGSGGVVEGDAVAHGFELVDGAVLGSVGGSRVK